MECDGTSILKSKTLKNALCYRGSMKCPRRQSITYWVKACRGAPGRTNLTYRIGGNLDLPDVHFIKATSYNAHNTSASSNPLGEPMAKLILYHHSNREHKDDEIITAGENSYGRVSETERKIEDVAPSNVADGYKLCGAPAESPENPPR
jgi:hypothetical protein